jgi:N-acyl-D-amino-acid deacylase
MPQYDLIVRNGTIVDGTGEPRFTGDIAVTGGLIAQVGEVRGDAAEEIDATGKVVTPGFVDIHTHYDGQATWDQEMAPSSWHGVTTVVMGNCGVGFAPAHPDRHNWLIGLMEGVEDIPGTALAEGMRWDWETFPEYLDALEKLPRTVDVGTHVPHGAVRAYVLGDRERPGAVPTPEDIEAMGKIVEEGVRAGALGFSTSRTVLHRSVDGEVVPGTTATAEELVGIGRAILACPSPSPPSNRSPRSFRSKNRSPPCAPRTTTAPTSSRRSRCAETASSWRGRAPCTRSA